MDVENIDSGPIASRHMEEQAPPAPAAAPVVSLPGYSAIVLPLIALAAQFGIGLLIGLVGIGRLMRQGGSPIFPLLLISGLSALCYLLILRILLKRRGWGWADLGLRRSAGLPIAVALGLGLMTSALGAIFDTAIQGPAGSPFRRLSPAEFLAATLVLGIVVPFGEEALFRGIVFPVLRARLGNALGAIMVSALIFGAFHLVPAQILVGFLLGLPLAWLRHWSGSLIAPMALHMTHNFGVVALAAWCVV